MISLKLELNLMGLQYTETPVTSLQIKNVEGF